MALFCLYYTWLDLSMKSKVKQMSLHHDKINDGNKGFNHDFAFRLN